MLYNLSRSGISSIDVIVGIISNYFFYFDEW